MSGWIALFRGIQVRGSPFCLMNEFGLPLRTEVPRDCPHPNQHLSQQYELAPVLAAAQLFQKMDQLRALIGGLELQQGQQAL